MLKSVADLVIAHLINRHDVSWLHKVVQKFSLRISKTMAQQITISNSPGLMRQFVPMQEELEIHTQELTDPISDIKHMKVKGLVHRYPDRVLLKIINVCPVYCRFCFRKEFLGKKEEALTANDLEACYQYLREHPEIWEVILTGGDPFMVSAKKLATIIENLNNIKHIEIIRIHTRVPIVDPLRIDTRVIAALNSKKPIYILIHANHPDEFTELSLNALRGFTQAGIPMLSQTVLLRGVNDDIDILSRLMRLFVQHKIVPHYLHHPDLVKGTQHLRVSIAKGQALMEQLRGRFSGLCQPKYVLDIPGGFGKSLLMPNYVQQTQNNMYKIKDYCGNWHFYEDFGV